MYFSKEVLEQLAMERTDVDRRFAQLLPHYALIRLNDPRAQEFAQHGFARRISTLARCIHNVFEAIPPDRVELPSKDERTDAMINLQSFVFNAFGAIDNLAWIWVSEIGLKGDDGKPVPAAHVGLGPSNKTVRATLSAEFHAYLNGFDDWFEYLADYRHALAHRIPLYIPPYVVTYSNEKAHRDLDTQMAEALGRFDSDEHARLAAEQLKLARFRPWMNHSFEEGAKPVAFHAQMLFDFKTVDELARRMLNELARPRAS